MEPRAGNQSDQGAPQGTIEELRALFQDFKTAMLVTTTPEGLLRGRPMAVHDPDEVSGCDLWFVTPEHTAKTGEIERQEQVAVCCYRPSDGAYVSISAMAEIDRDEEKIRRLWKPEWKAWMPDGPESPHAALLKLQVERAEYWEPAGGRLRVLYEKAKAVLKGRSASEGLNPPKHV